MLVSATAYGQCAPVQLIQNGGFELPLIANNSAEANVTPTGWTWTPVVGGFLFRGAVGPIWPLAPQESQFLDIGNAGPYFLQQVITVPHRQIVRMQWRASAAVGAVTSPYDMRVRRVSDGSSRFTVREDAAGPYPPGEFWDVVGFETEFEPGQYIVEFQARGVASGSDTLIDDVRIEALPGPAIRQMSASGSTFPGESITFAALIYGVPPFTTQWERRLGGSGPWIPLTDGFVPGMGVVFGSTTTVLDLSDLVPGGGLQEFRCVVASACGVGPDFLINPIIDVPRCDSIDFNRNGVFPEDQDVMDFFNVLAGADCPGCRDIDFNNNGVFPEDQDVADFFTVLAGGACG